jgi:hypothetical protein
LRVRNGEVTLEEIKACVDLAVGAFDDTGLDPRARARAAFEFLAAVSPNRDFLPPRLSRPFEEAWRSFLLTPGRDIEGMQPPSLAAIARSERLTREFARALDLVLAEGD